MTHRILATALLAFVGLPAGASFHLYTINEVYSNASGTVQYVELTALAGGQQFTTGHTLVSTDGATPRTVTVPANLPGDTSGHKMLFGTAGVQAAFGITPDYVIPNGFLHTAAGSTVTWAEGFDFWTHPAIPTSGQSLSRAGTTQVPTPQNFAGAVGIAPPPTLVLTNVVSGFSLPTDIRFAPGVTDRMFVVEKNGRIRVAVGNAILPADFLNLTASVSTSGERGLLGLAFHPNYATNRVFYVYYTAINGDITIARYLRNAANPDVADAASGAILLSYPHSEADNHNGGSLQFGPDGFLYFGSGDGGGGGDPFHYAQNIHVRLGKINRIAVDGGTGYTIPAGNMFPAGGTCATTGCPEILHIGARNPWRTSFDKLTGDLYIGDVGQNAFEEIDHFVPGAAPTNLGWGVFEANSCFNDNYFGIPGACTTLAYTPPVYSYSQASVGGGAAVTGGYVYRGSRIVGLGGFYLFGDYVHGNLWAGRMSGAGLANFSLAPLTLPNVTTFGQDAAGEVYGADIAAGKIYRFDPLPGAPDPAADPDNDGVPSGVEGQEGLDPFTKDNDVFTRSRLFAMQQYRDFLGREGDPGGIGFYTQAIDNVSSTRSQVIENFLASTEFQNGLPQCTRLYFSFFLRIPDYSGLQFQVNAFRTGTPLEAIAQNFYNSPEFTSRYGALSNDDYITLVYQNVLGRAPDPDGFAFYKNLLDNNMITKGQMMIGFSESPEFQQLSDNEVYVTAVYVGMLRRAPDQAGLDFYLNAIAGGTPRNSIITGFFNSPEYHNRFLP